MTAIAISVSPHSTLVQFCTTLYILRLYVLFCFSVSLCCSSNILLSRAVTEIQHRSNRCAQLHRSDVKFGISYFTADLCSIAQHQNLSRVLYFCQHFILHHFSIKKIQIHILIFRKQ
jgi:hypothetical protein